MTSRRSQAQRVIDAFGGVAQLHHALVRACGEVRSKKQIYCWMYSRDRGGTGGVIPHWMIPAIRNAARVAGVRLTERDLMVGER